MYTKRYIDIITLALVIIIFILINIYQFQIQTNIEELLNQSQSLAQTTQEVHNTNSDELINNNLIIEGKVQDFEDFDVPTPVSVVEQAPVEIEKYVEDWYIKIPSISLIAPIQQGTTTEILNKSVGHFEESPILKGNVCLAAHNRGYEVNYFEKIKDLLLNDIIIYQYGDIEKMYTVSNITIIKETDWSYVEEKGNKITLITCVDNKPEYRLCVQATEIK